MSSDDRAVLSLLSDIAFSFDGAVLGAALAYAAVRSVLKYAFTSAVLCKLRKAPYVRVSDLRSIVTVDDSENSKGKLVIVRGIVEEKSVIGGNSKSLGTNVFVSQESGDRAVAIQRTLTYIYHEWRGCLGLASDLRDIFVRSGRKQKSTSLKTAPFVLVEGGQWPEPNSVFVNMDGSKHPLPLITVYHKLQPVDYSPCTFLQALFGYKYPVGLLDEEQILPLGKDITAVGVCSLKNGNFEIKSCKDLPYFLSDKTKDQMVLEFTFDSTIMLLGGFILGTLSIGILGYAAVRNWNRWKEWKRRRQLQQLRLANNSASGDLNFQSPPDEEETEDVPDGQLCVICLMRRRQSAFIPCGHLVCCQYCALELRREVSPRCPVCRQDILNSMRICDS
ncbi:hypothetical protein FNV43_RR08129 [Rhamnella rubrinervis]|uniref:RING-type E3 ubiquitin transferase n=1 Tax=Rhamnella rubrinervis TaxID=2594499 RepID=A0A8K0MND1_9ROSA|nr:hypothetical protein FNV43_RR08129 [Rhamnella rubrinervis]